MYGNTYVVDYILLGVLTYTVRTLNSEVSSDENFNRGNRASPARSFF